MDPGFRRGDEGRDRSRCWTDWCRLGPSRPNRRRDHRRRRAGRPVLRAPSCAAAGHRARRRADRRGRLLGLGAGRHRRGDVAGRFGREAPRRHARRRRRHGRREDRAADGRRRLGRASTISSPTACRSTTISRAISRCRARRRTASGASSMSAATWRGRRSCRRWSTPCAGRPRSACSKAISARRWPHRRAGVAGIVARPTEGGYAGDLPGARHRARDRRHRPSLRRHHQPAGVGGRRARHGGARRRDDRRPRIRPVPSDRDRHRPRPGAARHRGAPRRRREARSMPPASASCSRSIPTRSSPRATSWPAPSMPRSRAGRGAFLDCREAIGA